ncbi:hypothetical protein AB4865_10360 [Capnocytophaga sp. ARDL2]|uniref:LPD3 domain-containing protein n=1 Tax=Capnocytophaga sp. ARDL2 TaxID=3238809 RepID=UPI00355732EC
MDCLKYEGRTYRPDVLYGKIQQNPEYFVRKHNLTEAMLNSDVSNELDFHIGSDENAVLRLRGLLGNLSKEIDADLYNELADVYRKYSTTDVMNANDFKQHFEGRLDKNVVDELVSIKRGFDAIKKREVRRKIEQRRSELREEVRREYLEKYNVVDTQGNRVDINGKLVTELIHSIDELTDDDFSNPSRTVRLPALSATVDSAIGANGKPVIIKKNIFEKNAKSHKDLSPDDSRMILDKALYDPTLYGQNQKAKKPHRWIVIHLADRNASVVLEVNNKKDNVEIVNWHFLNEKGIEKVKKQALREDGQLLILPSENSEEAGALSSRTQNLSDTNIQNDFELGNIQVSENGNSEVENKSKSDYRTGIRTHIDRMRRGEHSEETMMALDRLNRLYEVENQERAIDETNAWFDELAPMGYNGLRDLNLVREFFEDGYFKGGMLVAMYKNIFEGYEDYIHFYKSHNDIEQMNFYIEKQSTFIGAFDNEIRQSARVLSMLRRLYELDPRYAKRELERDFVRFVGREMNMEEKRQMELYYEEDRSIAKEIEEAMEGLEEAESKALAKQLAEKGRALRNANMRRVEGNDPNLRVANLPLDTEIAVVEAKKNVFKNFTEAKQWAKENIAKTYSDEETGGKGKIKISNNVINKYLSESAIDKSDSKDVHLSVLKVLPHVINSGIVAEQHSDFKKGEDGKRIPENGVNENVIIHRVYGSVEIDGYVYRVKVTLKENTRENDTPINSYSYEATKIELLSGTLVTDAKSKGDPKPNNSNIVLLPHSAPTNGGRVRVASNGSISLANLLHGVEFSYEKGKKILDAMQKAQQTIVSERGKAIADKIRQLKIKDNTLNAIAIPQALYNGALEITATAIEGGAKLYDAVRKGVQYIKKSGWYKRLSKAEQIEAVNEYRNLFESINDEAKELIYLKDDGSVSVPIGKLMEYAMNGKNSIMEIAEAIKVDMFGDNDLVSAKLIKDSIMGYYRKQPRNSNEVRDKIKEMKDIQRLIDQIVSIENGTYIPKRKERKEPVSNDELLKLKKTALQKRLRELMKQYDGEHKKQLTDAEKSKSNEKRLARMIEKAESDLIDLYNGILPMNEQSAREMSDKELELQDELSKKRKEIAKLKKEIEDANGTTEAKEVSAKEKMLERMKRKLEQDISDLERGIKQEVGNRKREVMSERITELEREIKELKADKKRLEKDQGITDEKELERYKKIIEAQQRRYERMLAEKNFYLPLPNKHPMNKEVQRLKRKRDDAKDKYMEAWLIARRKNRGWGRIIGNYVLGFFNTIRGSHATGDLSAIGIQGGFAQGYLIAQKGGIRKYIRALKRWNSIFNSKVYDRHLEEMKTHPMYELMKQTGVRLTEATAMSRVQEEGFFHNDAISMLQSRLDKGLSRFGMKTMSIERGTSAFLNQMRIEIFTLEATRLMNEGKTFETHPEEFNLLAMTTNTLTGAANYRWERNREDVANINGGKPTSSFTYNPNSKYSGLTELSSILLYSGRLMTSQLNMINPTNYFGGGSATTRKMYRQAFLMNLVTKSVSIGLMTFFYNATLKAYLWANREEEEEKWGVPIEDIYEFRKAKITLDWRDTDFGTITMRNMEGAKQQYNLWGGTKSMVVSSGRLLSWGANIATSNKYNIHSYRRTDEWGEEELKKLNESGYSATNVLLGTLFENKLAPGIGLVYGMASGNIKYTEDGRISIKRFGKDVFSFENVAPMSLSTLNDLYQTDVIRGMSELSDDTNGFDIFDAMIVVGTMTGGVNFKHEHKPFLNAKKAYEEYKAEELEWGEEPMEFEDFIKL